MLTNLEVTSITDDRVLSPHDPRSPSQTPHRGSATSNATRSRPHTVSAETSHTHATALLLAGISEHVVMRRLGHADVQTTLSTYGWVTADAEMRTLAEWKNYVAGWKVDHDGQ